MEFQIEVYSDAQMNIKFLVADNSGNIWRDDMNSLQEAEDEMTFAEFND